ncbi:major facilitator superfamily domain-containing protein [Kalaharituber pfeilii]|nr:major facilitator superfamily domain-containing protein [Kalaharituber pfeilii]
MSSPPNPKDDMPKAGTLPISPASTIAAGSVDTICDGEIIQLAGRAASSARWRTQIIAFCSAMLNCLCAGSLLLFSLWAPIFQDKLGFTQMQINAISIAGELGMYIPVPIFGAICDRYGPAKLSLLASCFFGPSYLLAAYAFAYNLPFYVMFIAFVFIGSGTASMGIALALPIAAFGLSSLWEAQLVSRFFHQEGIVGEVDIIKAFVFFAGLLTTVGIFGGISLTISPEVNNAQMATAADEENTEESSLLVGSHSRNYGTEAITRQAVEICGAQKDTGLLDAKTREFLSDPTMWWFFVGVFMTTGPGESFINNMGTLIRALYDPQSLLEGPSVIPLRLEPVDTATHVSIIAFTSTVARLIAGSLSDYLAPVVPVVGSEEAAGPAIRNHRKPTLSRMYLLVAFAALMCFAQLFVALGAVDQKPELFWIVSSAMGAGYGAVFTLAPTVVSVVWGVENFGTNWGIIAVAPAIGATLFGIIFAVNYDNAAKGQRHLGNMINAFGALGSGTKAGVQSTLADASNTVCYGRECYSTAFLIMGSSIAVACMCWVWAWRGRGGWVERKVAI